MNIIIRDMEYKDCLAFADAFTAQGWNKPIEQFQKYYQQQESGEKKIFVAEVDGQVAGYTTLLDNEDEGPFTDVSIIRDFNVLIRYQKQGIGSLIMNTVEHHVSTYTDRICLGVGMHHDYGSAQRMYVKRGYIPDGSGVWYDDHNLAIGAACRNDDGLILYLMKILDNNH